MNFLTVIDLFNEVGWMEIGYIVLLIINLIAMLVAVIRIEEKDKS